jgi:hypothetical protein
VKEDSKAVELEDDELPAPPDRRHLLADERLRGRIERLQPRELNGLSALPSQSTKRVFQPLGKGLNLG